MAAASSSSSTLNFHSVDSWAVSFPFTDPFILETVFENFLHDFEGPKGATGLHSTRFPDKLNPHLKWQLRVQRQGVDSNVHQLLSVYLYLIGPEKTAEGDVVKVAACFQVDIVDVNGSVYKSTGGPHEDPCLFRPGKGWGFRNFCSLQRIRKNTNKLLPNGQFTLRCKLWMVNSCMESRKGRGGESWDKSLDKPDRVHQLSMDYRKLLDTGIGSDFTIVVVNSKLEQNTFSTHKAVLAARSPVFAAIVHNAWIESQLSSVQIVDFDSELVYTMLEFMYTGEVNQNVLESRPAELLQIADKYCLDDFRDLCEDEVVSQMDIDNAADILLLADIHSRTELKEKALHFIKMNRERVQKTESFSNICKNHPNLIVDLYLSDD